MTQENAEQVQKHKPQRFEQAKSIKKKTYDEARTLAEALAIEVGTVYGQDGQEARVRIRRKPDGFDVILFGLVKTKRSAQSA